MRRNGDKVVLLREEKKESAIKELLAKAQTTLDNVSASASAAIRDLSVEDRALFIEQMAHASAGKQDPVRKKKKSKGQRKD